MTFHIDGAALATRVPNHPFPYPTARSFQADYLDWLHDDSDYSIAVLQAPTGGGKTAAFTELIRDRDLSLVIYPTNALMEQQCEILEEEDDLSIEVINADTLNERGLRRRDELLNYAEQKAHHDAIVTNPDILQAIIQNQYVDVNAKLMRFFERFDGVIIDEFHAYDAFAASGLLLQLKLFAERGPAAKLTLASATPRDDYLEFLEASGMPITRIGATYADPNDPDANQFRHPISLDTASDRLLDAADEVADQLRDRITNTADLSECRIALIFNSAWESNRFYSYLEEQHEDVYEHCEKDNGYETKSEVDLADEFFILNTTSKGEVGLDYDLDTLYMEMPRTADKFIQRVGRAGRHQPATVYVHDCGELPWPSQMEYETFLDTIWDTFHDPQTTNDRLEGLLALRGAHAVWSRENERNNMNPELYEDFATLAGYSRWYDFIDDVTAAANDGPASIIQTQPTIQTQNVLEFTTSAFDVLTTLRGRTLSHDIEYPRGGTSVATEYGLISALRWYRIADVTDDDDERVILEETDEEQSIRLNYEGLPESFELSVSMEDHHGDVWEAIKDEVEATPQNLGVITGHMPSEFLQFITLVGVQYVGTPELLVSGDYEFTPDDDGFGLTVNQRN